MVESRQPSPFIEPAAVEAWDAWFRLRDSSGLRDVSIEDTWRRVADTLASVETGGGRRAWASRFMEAFANWRLLPDERLLESTGTGRITWGGGVLHAALNAAAFVPAGMYPARRVELTALRDCAEVAVRALDNAALLAGVPTSRLRIGMVGIADALMLLGLNYDSAQARAQASLLAKAIAEGCFRASVELAAKRGCVAGDPRAILARALSRGISPGWLTSAERHGLRHPHLTAITSQWRLALLANNVADALDPLLGENHPYTIAAPEGERTVRSSGYALSMLQKRGGNETSIDAAVLGNMPWTAQIAMRAAVQPWVDEPIAYPLLLEGEPDPHQHAEAQRKTAMHRLGAPVWRSAIGRGVPCDSQRRAVR